MNKNQFIGVITIFLIFFVGVLIGSLVTSDQNRLEDSSTFIDGLVSAKVRKEIKEHFYQFPPNLDMSMSNITYTATSPHEYMDLLYAMTSSLDLAVGTVYTYFYCEVQFNKYIQINAVENLTADLIFNDNKTYDTIWLIFQTTNLFEPEIEQNKFIFVFTVLTSEIIAELGFDE